MPLARLLSLSLSLAAFPLAIAHAAPEASAEEAPVAIEDTSALSAFFQALDAVRSGARAEPVTIAWYGDSAIVADGYTRAVRARLRSEVGDGGPGFVLAGVSFDGYLREGVRMKRSGWKTGSVLQGDVRGGRYGYGGVVAFGTRGASLTLELLGEGKGAEPAPVTAVEVFVQTGPRAGELGLYVDGAREPVETFSAKADMVGDAVWRPSLPEAATSEVRVKVLAGGVRVYGVSLGRGAGVQLDALGILGLRARRWLNADAEHLSAQVKARGPELLALNFGGNERVDPGLSAEAHQQDLEQVLDALRGGARTPACVIIGPLAHGVPGRGGKVLDPALSKLYEGQRAAAASRGCAFVDTIGLMGGHTDGTLRTWRKKSFLSGDYAHLTNAGHAELGHRFARVLVSAWRASAEGAP